jgi:hypothetical protein
MRVAATSAVLLLGYSTLRMCEHSMPAGILDNLFIVNGISVSAAKISGDAPTHIYRWSQSERSAWLQPFAPACTVLGALTLYIALLIMSSRYYYYDYDYRLSRNILGYAPRNGIMIVCLVAGLVVGNLEGMPGLTNTANTFGVLYLVEKYCELHFENKWNLWLLMLALSVAMYQTALYLHLRPEFVVSLFAN